MDAFFAAVEERESPQFEGKPLVVGADPLAGRGRGVVSTANYLARQYGIHSALPISKAWQFSEIARKSGKPAVVFLPGNYEMYGRVSEKIFAVLRQYSPMIEEAGIDEAYFDLTVSATYEKAKETAEKIKQEIKEKEKLIASVGIGPNKLIAKIASDYKKPDGLTVIATAEAEKFLEDLPIRKIPGIGPKTEELLKKQRITLVKHLKNHSIEQLEYLLGKWGRELYRKIRGVDESPLTEGEEAKSIGEQETFLIDTRDPLFIFERLKFLCQSVFKSFNESDFNEFRTVVLTVRFADFETKSRSHTLKEPARIQNILEFEAMKSLLPFLDKRENPRNKLIRLIGVRIEKLG
jgi:DNA polymerase IV (DinB-like DNA polymerase)